MRILCLGLAALAAACAVRADEPDTPPRQVLRLAPQLEAFAGSRENFDSLANGLSKDQGITLTTVAETTTETVTFSTAGGPRTAGEVAQLLELARQQLITRGVGHPTAQQIGVALVGGTLSVHNADIALQGLVVPDPKRPMHVVTASRMESFAGSKANLDSLNAGLAKGGEITLTKPPAAAAPGETATFEVPGGPMGAEEAKQTLDLAAKFLAQQGILNPTPQQLRAALLGGAVTSPAYGTVQLRGVLEGRVKPATPPAPIGTKTLPLKALGTPPEKKKDGKK